MYAGTIYKGDVEVAKVYAKTAFGAENKAIDYIEDIEDEGVNVDGYDYNVSAVAEEAAGTEDVPAMPAEIAWLYTPQFSGDIDEPPILAPIWEDAEDEEPPVEEDMDPEDLPTWDPYFEGLDPNPYFYCC